MADEVLKAGYDSAGHDWEQKNWRCEWGPSLHSLIPADRIPEESGYAVASMAIRLGVPETWHGFQGPRQIPGRDPRGPPHLPLTEAIPTTSRTASAGFGSLYLQRTSGARAVNLACSLAAT